MRQRLALGNERARPIVTALEQMIGEREQLLADDAESESPRDRRGREERQRGAHQPR
jgi:hypothetical protein